jgi:hypothetical protein
MMSDLSAFSIALVMGLIYLSLRGKLVFYELIGSAALMMGVFLLGGILLLGIFMPSALHGVLSRLQRLINRAAKLLRRGTPIGEGWAETHAAEFCEAAGWCSCCQRLVEK